MSEHDQALGQALAAYAGAAAGDALDTELLRARILRSASASRARPLRRLSFVLPLVAVFAASAAFAASQPQLLAAITTGIENLLSRARAAPHPAAQRRPPTTPRPSIATPPADATPSVTAAPSAEAAPPIAIEALPLAPAASPSPSAMLPSVGRPGLKAAAAPDEGAPNEASAELAAYRAAHRIHFDGGSPAASLLAWDRYLEDFPAGSFADDARFNRALCLIRLARHAEARAALRPFAAAPAGSYRQREAAALLRSLPPAQP